MAYTKQTWTNDVTAITAERMTHIENGIYDNSLATDKIKPSGTATTTAEIEEGQINDVIGFKSLKLKGQTSQETTTGKNLLAIKQLTTQTINGVTFTPHYTGNKLDYVNVNGTATATAGYFLDNASIDQASTYTNELPSGTYILDNFSGSSSVNTAIFFRYSTDNSNLTTINSVENSRKITIDSTFKFASYIRIASGTTVNNMKFYPQLETGNAETTYEPYTGGKASPNPDYPQDVNNVSGYNVIEISNKNIFDKDDSNSIFSGFPNGATNKLQSNANAKTAFIPCKPSTKYTVSKTSSARFIVADTASNSIVGDIDVTMLATATNVGSHTVTTSANAKYLLAFYYLSTADTKTEQEIRNSLQIEQSNSATTYTAHQGNNFELNFTKNLFDSEKYLENASISNNTIVSTNNNNLFYIPVQYGRNYTFSFVDNGVSGNILYGFSNDKPVIGGACTYNILDITQLNKHTFTPVSTNNKYLCIRLNVVNTNQYLAMENIQVEVGNQATEYIAYNENPIELCKISTYEDYIFKRNGKWYKYKAIEKIILNGTESWVLDGALTSTNRFRLNITSYNTQNIGNANAGYNNQLPILNSYDNDSEHMYAYKPSSNMNLYAFFNKTRCADLTGLQTWLSANNLIVYALLATPIEEEIAYTPLIRQSDELYNSGLYDVTNISQDNSSEAFVLDFEACKNNINGIVEYIRR